MFEYFGSGSTTLFLIATREDGTKTLININHIVQIKSRDVDLVGCVIYMRDGRSTIVQQTIDNIHKVIIGDNND
jgi:hypothetical protein